MAIMTIMIVVNFLLYFLHFVELENFNLTWCNDWAKFPLVESTAKSDGIKGKSEPEPQDPSYVSSRDLQTELCYHVGGNPINWANFWQFGSKREYNRPPWYNFDSMSRSTHTGCTKKKLKLSEILKIKFEQYIWCQGGGKGRHVTYQVEEGVEGPWKGSEGSWNSSSRLKKSNQAKPTTTSEKEPEPYCFPCFRWSLIMVTIFNHPLLILMYDCKFPQVGLGMLVIVLVVMVQLLVDWGRGTA